MSNWIGGRIHHILDRLTTDIFYEIMSVSCADMHVVVVGSCMTDLVR